MSKLRLIYLLIALICCRLTVSASDRGAVGAGQGSDSDATEIGPNRPGSVLLYNYFTSSIDSGLADTGIYVTNINQVKLVYLRVLFVDSVNCSVISWSMSLRANRSVSFLVSDIDPLTSGYILMVAIDQYGCPVKSNDLIGGEYIRLESGLNANLSAIGIPVIAGNKLRCLPESITVELVFDGEVYGQLPRTVVIDNLASIKDGNQTRVILHPLGGDMTGSPQVIGDLEGLLFNDESKAYYFKTNVPGCQLFRQLENGFPPTDLSYEDVIPKGGIGWVLFYITDEKALYGAVFRSNSKGLSTANNLHYTTLASKVVYTIPLFQPNR